ncbi:KapN protein, variant [Blastomyces dermatitidis ER-3]|uniref:KapN protein n=1 Tax=Ajellomyces dermatitidis (strain ER-3 / ATCC MYA-2586) TaxID=559297 RepID=A0ABX2W161_AJEDR|nr:KapN protein [Blastomyces dermatitidis ER-3]XP_045282857.1 KapN protein, variant [Blastomyces dermatitidis ER-3]OAT03129.1 KapN protein [Blastomyces dermatitidis ER-3]OAT03130.1 KapN protein, variant [Blastomyces dermatitidis ER-3]
MMAGIHSAEQESQGLIDESLQLIHVLNAPGNAAIAKSIQERLQALQKSEAGWAIADGLLTSDDANARFFGALTLTVKIHQDWDHLGEEKAKDLLEHLTNLFILMVSRNEGAVSMRKFMSTLTTFFFKPEAPWTHCIRHIAMSMASGKYLSEDQCEEGNFEKLALPSLSYERMLPLLSFSTILAEESSRYALNEDLRGRLGPNLRDALYLVQFVLEQVSTFKRDGNQPSLSDQLNKLAIEAMKSLNAWLIAIRGDRISPGNLTKMVAVPLNYSVQFLAVPELAEMAMELLAEILNSHAKLLGVEHLTAILQFLSGNFGEKYALALLNADYDEDSMRFLDLLLRYAATEHIQLFTGELNEQKQRILFLLHTLFRGPGFVEVDDKASSLLLEYWTEAADDISDYIMQGEMNIYSTRVKGEFVQVIADCYDKLRYPDPSVLKEWDDDDVRNFNGFRRDFADFLLATYPLLGFELIEKLVERATSSMNSQIWEGFEVAVFCLGFLADSVVESPNVDKLLHTIFHSEIFNGICFNRISISMKPRQTLSDMIARYTAYFERNHDLLPRVLNFLFNSLDAASCDQAASKSISFLCQNSRQALPMYVDDFINKLDQLRSNSSVNVTTLERVSEGIAAVVQAATPNTAQATSLVKLLAPLHQLAEQARLEAQSNQYDEALEKGIKVMRCTASIGKGFRAPDDAVIDLDAEGPSESTNNFWARGELGGAPQAYLIQILDILIGTFPTDGDIIEATCDVLKAGYTEHTPGPYVLPPQVTIRFIKAANVTSPRFPTIMGTASAFLASHSAQPLVVQNEAAELIVHVYELMSFMNTQPDQYDPEVAHSCIDFLNLMLPKHKAAFFNLVHSPIPQHSAAILTILTFTLAVLKRPDPLPLRSASAFWSTLFSLTDLPPELQPGPGSSTIRHATTAAANGAIPQHAPRFFDTCISSLGNILMYQVSGHCARSDLDHLSEVVKKFIFHYQGAARVHFGAALAEMDGALSPDGAGGGGRVPEKAERERFLSSMLSLRGSRGTSRVVKDYWVACRGKGFAYAS